MSGSSKSVDMLLRCVCVGGYDKAIEILSEMIDKEEGREKEQLIAYRADVKFKSADYNGCLDDCNALILPGLEPAHRMAVMRLKGLSLFLTQRYKDALAAFEGQQALLTEHLNKQDDGLFLPSDLNRFEAEAGAKARACAAEMKLTNPLVGLTRQSQMDVKTSQLTQVPQPCSALVTTHPGQAASPQSEMSTLTTAGRPVRHDFAHLPQGDVCITVYIKEAPSEACDVSLSSSTSLTFTCSQLPPQYAATSELSEVGGLRRRFVLSLDPLYAPVKTTYQPKITVKKSTIEIRISPEDPTLQWPHLTRSSGPPHSQSHLYPSSKGDKDWASIEKAAASEDPEENEANDPLDSFLKRIYANSDEATRQAMNKSYQTSGGTVLSTNWQEVSKTNYENEIKPPQGQEVRRFNQ
eukprot:GHVN01025253.1.p1 GENE.GHVN01025253.1~~GHVN01025253.1.p1  ORF type:complete len:458 (-),score=91.06 GHVN01025253.1:80-1306(-)